MYTCYFIHNNQLKVDQQNQRDIYVHLYKSCTRIHRANRCRIRETSMYRVTNHAVAYIEQMINQRIQEEYQQHNVHMVH